MSTNVILHDPNTATASNKPSSKHFHDFDAYLNGLQHDEIIESYQVVFLNRKAGDEVNGFFWIHGSSEQLSTVYSSPEWHDLVVKSSIYLEGFGVIGGVTGELVMKRMDRWNRRIT